jgi:hypothetical protein
MPPRSRTAAVSALASYGGEESPVTGARPAENPAPSACDVYVGARQSNTNPCRLDCNVELGALICTSPVVALAMILKSLNPRVSQWGVCISANTQSSRNAVAARDGRHSSENSIGRPAPQRKDAIGSVSTGFGGAYTDITHGRCNSPSCPIVSAVRRLSHGASSRASGGSFLSLLRRPAPVTYWARTSALSEC